MRGSQRSNLKYIYYKIVCKESGKKLQRPLFKGGTKEDNYVGYPDETSLSGKLTQLKFETFEYEGKKRTSIKITLEDAQAEESYVISVGWTQLGRDILNSLLNIKKLGKIGFSLYTNKEGFHAVGVYNNDEWAGFKHEYKNYADKITTVKIEGEDVRQFGEVNKMFQKDIEETFLPLLSEAKREQLEDDSGLPETDLKPSDYRKKNEEGNDAPPHTEDDGNSLPF